MIKKIALTIVAVFAVMFFSNIETQAQNKKDVVFISGVLKKADTKKKVLKRGETIEIDVANEAILQANFERNGLYSIVLDKTKLEFPFRMVIKAEGYQDFIIDGLSDTSHYVQFDILLNDVKHESIEYGELKAEANVNNDVIINISKQ